MSTIIVGGGLGGLSAAIALRAAGEPVRLLEAAPTLGGKLDTVTVDGVAFDTGPSVMTLPDVAAAVLARAGVRLEDVLTLHTPSPAFRYHFPKAIADGPLDVFVDVDETLASVRDTLGADAADDLRAFLAYARGIWEASKDHFVFAKAPSVGSLVRLALRHPRDLLRVDPFHTMATAAAARVRHPALQLLLLRYATYNGSDPYTAPATLHCIAHVELGLGGYGIVGGMGALRDVLVQEAERLGVVFETGCPVRALQERADGTITGVVVDDGRTIEADAVVVNADVGWLRTVASTSVVKALPKAGTPSMSGATAVLKCRRRDGADARVAHEVFFADDYRDEARDIFERRRPPVTPTVYLCAQEQAHRRQGWAAHEPVFAMVNVPALSERRPTGGELGAPGDDDAACLHRGLERLRAAGHLDVDDEVIWQRTGADLGARFAGSAGSLYGAASNDAQAAFRRPANALKVPGLFLASGSAHPGGGVPLCLQSGLLAADARLAAR